MSGRTRLALRCLLALLALLAISIIASCDEGTIVPGDGTIEEPTGPGPGDGNDGGDGGNGDGGDGDGDGDVEGGDGGGDGGSGDGGDGDGDGDGDGGGGGDGGGDGGESDPTIDARWTALPNPSAARQEVAYTRVGSRLYLAGAGTLHEAYDTGSGKWTTVAPLPDALDHIQSVAIHGQIYYVGGLDAWPDGDVSSVYVYDILTDSFSDGESMPVGRSRGAGGVATHGGVIYYAGGLHDGEAVSWFDAYDPSGPEGAKWEQLPPMPRARDHFHAVVVDDRFYAIGGRDTDIWNTLPYIDVFDFAAGEWQTLDATLPTERGGFAAAVLDGQILVIGGESGEGAHDEVEIFDPSAQEWTTATPMPTPRHGIQAAVCNGTAYLAAGGEQPAAAAPTDVHEAVTLDQEPPTSCPNPLDDVQELVWERLPDDPYARAEAQGTAVDDILYVFGGFGSSWNGYCVSTRSDAFDARAEVWISLDEGLPDYLTHAGLAVDGDLIHLAGGRRQSDRSGPDDETCSREEAGTTEIYTFDTTTATWTGSLPELPEPRSAGGLARLGRWLHYVAGVDHDGDQEAPEHWALNLDDPSSGWQPRDPLPNPRNHVGVAVLDGLMYVIGGQHGTAEGNIPQDDVHAYDPATDEWTQRKSLPMPISHNAPTVTYGGRVLVLGGESGHDALLEDVLAYDPVANDWTALTPLPEPGRAGVVTVRNGIITYVRGEFSQEVYRATPDVQW